jgi:hypothetical protein
VQFLEQAGNRRRVSGTSEAPEVIKAHRAAVQRLKQTQPDLLAATRAWNDGEPLGPTATPDARE